MSCDVFFQTHLIVDNIFEHNGISNLVNKFQDVEARETLCFTIIILYTVRDTDIHLQNAELQNAKLQKELSLLPTENREDSLLYLNQEQ